jgi:hypothetical protein
LRIARINRQAASSSGSNSYLINGVSVNIFLM